MQRDSGLLTLAVIFDTKMLEAHKLINNFQLHNNNPRFEDYIKHLRSITPYNVARKLAQEYLEHPQAWEEKNGIIRRKICLQ